MKISGRREYLANLESIALTDIVMNLFIFFFISFSLLYTFTPDRMKKLEIQLPQARSGRTLAASDTQTISINNKGVLYFNGEAVTKDELQRSINELSRTDPDAAIQLQADTLTQFKDVVWVLDTLTGNGIRKINVGVAQSKRP